MTSLCAWVYRKLKDHGDDFKWLHRVFLRKMRKYDEARIGLHDVVDLLEEQKKFEEENKLRKAVLRLHKEGKVDQETVKTILDSDDITMDEQNTVLYEVFWPNKDAPTVLEPEAAQDLYRWSNLKFFVVGAFVFLLRVLFQVCIFSAFQKH